MPTSFICHVCQRTVPSAQAFTVRHFVACSPACFQTLRTTQLQAVLDQEKVQRDQLAKEQDRLRGGRSSGGGGPPVC